MIKKILFCSFVLSLLFITVAQADEPDTDGVWYEITNQENYDDNGSIKWCNFNYHTVDAHGEPITLSSYMRFGKDSKKVDPLKLNNIVLVEHYTITRNIESPTGAKGGVEIANIGNHLVIMPDYQGFGATSDKRQNYLLHHVIARQSYDALVAGYKIFKDISKAELRPGWRLFVAGCSQGGANAVAVQRYMEENDLDKIWRFAFSFVCAGPYNPVKAVEVSNETGGTSFPVGTPLIMSALYDGYTLLSDKYDESEFYSPEYNAIREEMDEIYASKRYSITEINSTLRNKLGCEDIVPLSKIVSAESQDLEGEMARDIYTCMASNNILEGWQPRNRIKAYHSNADEVVPFVMSQDLCETFGTIVTGIALNAMSHALSCIYWMSLLDKAFPYSETSGIEDINETNSEPLRIYDLQGREINYPVPGQIVIINGKKIVCPYNNQ